MSDTESTIRKFLAAERERQTAFLAELVKTPSDNPPGGPERLLGQGISKPDYAIAAGFSYAVVNARTGCLHLEGKA